MPHNLHWCLELNNCRHSFVCKHPLEIIIILQFGLVLVGLSSVLRDNHQGTTQGQVVLGRHFHIL